MKMIKEPYSKELQKCLAQSPLKISNDKISGVIQLQKVRKYSIDNTVHHYFEVDLLFKGKMHAYQNEHGYQWYESEILFDKGTSKIRVHRNIKNQTFNSVINFLTMFFGDGQHYRIKKVSWE